jgi:hypothetical protein
MRAGDDGIPQTAAFKWVRPPPQRRAGQTVKIRFVVVPALAESATSYLVGRDLGFHFLTLFGYYMRMDESRIKLGQYLFMRLTAVRSCSSEAS